jgi:hypothetical protein
LLNVEIDCNKQQGSFSMSAAWCFLSSHSSSLYKESIMKNYIRLLVLAAVVLLSATALIAQIKDIVYLKNGSVIKGTILEMIPEKTIKIQTSDGNIFVYKMSEVEKVGKDAAAPSTEPKPAVERPANEPQQQSYDNQRGYQGQTNEGGLGPKFSIYGGISLPLGDFAKKFDESENAGGAKLGWSAGMQFVTGGSVGLVLDGNYSQNKIDWPDSYATAPGKYSTTGWSSILALAGLKIGTDNATGSNFFIAPLVGGLFGTSPQVEFSQPGSSTSQIWMHSGKGTAFAYGGTLQILFGKNVTLSAKYIMSKPKFKYSDNGHDYESDPVNVSFLLASFGLAF